MEESLDVCIVGGGPAGVITAITIAQKNYKVAIIDRKKRDKIGDKTCGDAVDLAALERLRDGIGIDLPEGSEVSDTIYKMSIAVDNIDNKLSLDAPGFLVDRLNFGQNLLKQAESLGVVIIDSATVRDLFVEKINGKTFVTGLKYLKQGEHEIKAKIIIDASGAYAVVRKLLPDELLIDGMKRELDADEQWPSYREIIELKEEHRFRNEIILKYDKDYPPPGYFWVFSKGENKLNVGIGWAKNQDLGPMKEAFLKEMDKYYPRDSYTVLRKGGGLIPFRIPFDSCVYNGGALVGDAACMVHPVTAEGHGPALDTAWRLGKVVIKALEKADYSRDSLWDYNSQIAKHYGRKHTEAEIFRRMIEKVGVDGLKFLFSSKVFNEQELNLVFSGGTLDLSFFDQLKRVVKLLRKPSLLLELKSIFSKINNCKKIYSQYPTSPVGIEEWRILRNKMLSMSY